MESFIKEYFNSIFNSDEKKLFLNNYCVSLKHFEQDWNKIEKEYGKLLNTNKFHLTLENNASYFIEELFNKHVDNDTFIIGCLVHSTIIKELERYNNKYILSYNDIKNLNINKLILKYKESNCKKLFIYLSSTVEQQLVSQLFYENLKKELVNQNINHIIVLDDVTTMFIIPKNYEIFDYIIYTGHSLLPNFNCGMLFYKNNIDTGYKDYIAAYTYLQQLLLFLSKKDKILLFNIMMQQYFIEELSYNIFNFSNFTTPNIFYIILTNNKLYNVVNKYKEELKSYDIYYNDGIIIIRFSHLLNQDIDKIMEGLEKLKQILQKCIKLKDKL